MVCKTLTLLLIVVSSGYYFPAASVILRMELGTADESWEQLPSSPEFGQARNIQPLML